MRSLANRFLTPAIFSVAAAIFVLSAIVFFKTYPNPRLPNSTPQLAVTVDEVIRHLEESFPTDAGLPSKEEMYRIGIDAILKEVGDKHGRFLPKEDYKELRNRLNPTHYGGLNIQVSKHSSGSDTTEMLILQVFDGSPLPTFGVRAGDTITHVNGEQVTNENWSQMVANIRGPIGSDVRLTVKRDGGISLGELTFVRVDAKLQTVFAKHENCYVHLRITLFTSDPVPQMAQVLDPIIKECNGGFRGLILDVRNDPGGSLRGAVNLADTFLEKGVMIVKTVGKGEENNSEIFSKHDPIFPSTLPVVALVNSGSASASEILVGALKKHLRRFAVIGEKTYGKGSVQTIFPMHDGHTAVKITTAEYLAGGTLKIDGIGITPNQIVEQPSPPGYSAPQRIVNAILIANSMNAAIDHQLRMAYLVVAHMANNDKLPDNELERGVLHALESIKDEKPVLITSSVCRESGLRGCPPPGSTVSPSGTNTYPRAP